MNFLWAIGLLVASFLIKGVTKPKTPRPAAATLEEFNFPRFEEGVPQSVVFGDVWIEDPQVLCYGNLYADPISVDSGGK